MKRNLIASVIIIAALVSYLLFINRDRSDVPDLPSWEGPSDEIVINGPATSISLTRKGGTWFINKEAFPADRELVGGIEKTLRGLSIVDIVSEKGIYSTYDLVPGKYTEVIVRSGGETVRHVFFGKKSTASQHIFIRLGADREIYMARGSFDSLLDDSAESLRDKGILTLSGNDITGLAFTFKGKTITLALENAVAKKDGDPKDKKGKGKEKAVRQWVARGPKTIALDPHRMNSLLKVFSPLTATGFSVVTKESLRAPVATVVVKTARKEITLTLFEKEKEFLAVSSESPYVFTVSEWTARKFMVENIDNFKAGQ